MSDTSNVSWDLWRSRRHLIVTLAVALLAAATLAVSMGYDDSPGSDGKVVDIQARNVAQAQVGQCHTATNSAHADAGRATRFLLFTWARGSNTYLGLIWTSTSLREGPTGTWTLVQDCEAPPAATGWPTAGFDLASTRAVLSEDDISPSNINTLGRAWQTGNIEGVSGTPIVVGGTVYIGDWTGRVRALDAITGQERWARDLGGGSVPAPGGGNQIPGAVAVDDTRVYAGTWDGSLFALNRETGAPVWEKQVDTHDLTAVYGSPIVADGKVIVPVASDEWWEGANYNFRGSVVAFDAANGNEVWRYWTSCGPENAGRNNCPAGGPNEGPGVGVWAYPAVDLQRNTLYFGTGNQYSTPTSGRSDSLIALNLDTGQQRFVHQFTANDWWNLPAQSRNDPGLGPDADVMVATLFDVGGVPAVGVGDKGGSYYAVNRDTGQRMWSRKLTQGSIQGGVMSSATVVPGSEVGLDRPVIYVTSNRGGQSADLYVLDSSNGNVLWVVDIGGSVVGQPTWANGLIFVADNTGRIAAYDGVDLLRRKWSWKTQTPAAGGIAVVDGMVYAGWGWSLTGESPNGGLIAYKLGGEPQDEDPPDPPDGAAIYAANCAGCHGPNGEGGGGPSLQGHAQGHTREETLAVVTNGRGGMPAWGTQLSAAEIGAVVDYVRTFEGEHGHGEH